MPEPTIPVQVDSIKRWAEFQKTRCIYFRVEFPDRPVTGPSPDLYGDKAVLSTWGSWAVLSGPSRSIEAEGLFLLPKSIEQTLLRIEETEGLSLDLAHIWMPNELFDLGNQDKEIRSGDVYRLSTALFRVCYLFAAEMITEDRWLNSCRSSYADIIPSPEETAAFRSWRKEQIERSSSRYHHKDYATRRLPKKRAKK